jgi:hypothetical protein
MATYTFDSAGEAVTSSVGLENALASKGTIVSSLAQLADECATEEVEELEEEEDCSGCQPDDNAMVPIWTDMQHGECYFNGKVCEYQTVIATEYTSTGGDELGARMTASISGAAEKLLEFYDKAEEFDLMWTQGGGGATNDTLEYLRENITPLQWHMPLEEYLPIKVLHGIDADIFDGIPAAPPLSPSESETIISSGSVSIKAEELPHMIRRVSRLLRIYSDYSKFWLLEDIKGPARMEPVDLKEESENLKLFKVELKKFIEDNGYYLPHAIRLGGVQEVENIEMGFDEGWVISYIRVNGRGCEQVELKKGWKTFLEKEPINLSRTVGYFAKLVEMDQDARARTPRDWREFVEEYTYPPVEYAVYEDDFDVNEDLGAAGCALDKMGAAIANMAQNGLMSAIEIFSGELRNNICLSLDNQMIAEDEFLRDAEIIRKIASTQALVKHAYQDKVMGQMREMGSAFINRIDNLDDLWNFTLSPLGKCGFAALFQAAMGCFMDGLGFDKVIEKLVKAAVNAMNEEVIGRLIGFLPPELQAEIKAAAFQTIDPDQMAQFLEDNAGQTSDQMATLQAQIDELQARYDELDGMEEDAYDTTNSFDGGTYADKHYEKGEITNLLTDDSEGSLNSQMLALSGSLESFESMSADLEEFGDTTAAASWLGQGITGTYNGQVFDIVIDTASTEATATSVTAEDVETALAEYENGQTNHELGTITDEDLAALQETYDSLANQYAESESNVEVEISDAIFGLRIIVYDPDTDFSSMDYEADPSSTAVTLGGSPLGYITSSPSDVSLGSAEQFYYRQVDGNGGYTYNQYYNTDGNWIEIVRGELGSGEMVGDGDTPVASGEGFFVDTGVDAEAFLAIVGEIGEIPDDEAEIFSALMVSGGAIDIGGGSQGPIMTLDEIDRAAYGLEMTSHADSSYEIDSAGVGTGQATVNFDQFVAIDPSTTQTEIAFAPIPPDAEHAEAFEIFKNIIAESVIGPLVEVSVSDSEAMTALDLVLTTPGANPSIHVKEYGSGTGGSGSEASTLAQELEELEIELANAQSLAEEEGGEMLADNIAELENSIEQVQNEIDAGVDASEIFLGGGMSMEGVGGAGSIEGFPDPFGVGVAFDGEAMLDAMLDAFKAAIIEYYKGAYEELMEQIEKLPGYELVQRIMAFLDCGDKPPLFSPPLDTWLKDLDLNFCRELEPIVWPEIREINFIFPDLKKILIEAAKATLRRLLLQALTWIIMKLLRFLEFSLCDAMKKLGAMTADMMKNGFDAFTAELTALLGCGEDLSAEELEDAVADIMESAGFAAASVSAGTEEEGTVMSRWIQSIQAVITEEEFHACINGEASETTLGTLAEVTKIQTPELAETGLGTKSGIRKFFNGIGALTNLPLFNKRFDEAKFTNEEFEFDGNEMKTFLLSSMDRPMNPQYCEPDNYTEFISMRKTLLRDKDPEMTDEQIEEQINNYEVVLDEMLGEFAEGMADQDAMLENLLPPFLSESNTCPGVTGDGLLAAPSDSPMQSAKAQQLAEDLFGAIQSSYYEELMGRRGFFSMILANANGTSLRTHYSLWNTFGWILPIPGEGLPETVATYLKMELMNQDHFTFSPVSTDDALSKLNDREPDCVLKYSDEGATQQQGYSFDVNYWNYMFEDDGSISTQDKYRIQVTDSPSIPPELQEYLIAQAEAVGNPVPTFDENYGTVLVDGVGTASIEEDVEEVLDALDGFDMSAGYSRQAEAFAALFCESWNDLFGDNASTYIRTTVREHARRDIFSTINERFLEMMAMEISYPEIPHDKTYSAGSGEAAEMPAYYYGDKEPASELWGGMFFKSPNYGRINENEGGLIDLASEDESRINAADQGAYYGLVSGSLASARGLSSIAGMFIPPWHGCEPGFPDPIKWQDIGNLASGVGEDDERLQNNPACRREPPFSRIHSKVSRGMIHATIKSYIRLNLVEMLLKGLGPFSTFKINAPNNLDHVLKSYASSKIEQTLKDDSSLVLSPGEFFERLGGLPEDELNYYYEFMEQVTQMTLDRVEAGDITLEDLPEAVKASVENIQKQVKKWVEPVPFGLDQTDPRIAALITICLTAPGYAPFIPIVGTVIKAFLRERKTTWRNAINDNLEDARTIMRYVIEEEFDEVADGFYELIGEPAQDDLNKLIYNVYNNNWIPTMDVPSNLSLTSEEGSEEAPDGRFGNFLFNEEAQFAGNQIEGERGAETTITPDRFGKGWFVLEKYVRITEKYEEDDIYETSGYYESGGRTDLDAYLAEQVQFAIDSYEDTDALAAAYGEYIGKTVEIRKVDEGGVRSYAIYIDGELWQTAETDDLSLIGYQPYERDSRLYGVVNLNTWQEFLATQSDLADETIQSLFEGWNWGLRLSYVAPMETVEDWDNQPADIYEPILNNETGNMARAEGFTTVNAGRASACLKEKAYGVPEDPAYSGGSSGTEETPEEPIASETQSANGRVSQSSADSTYATGKNYIIPLISIEKQIEGTTKMSEFDAEDHEYWCLWNELVKSPHHKMLFDYCFPVKRMLGLATIYNIHGLLPSVGIRDGEWTKGTGGPGGQFGYRMWDQEVLTDTRKLLKKMFNANYNIKDESYKDEEESSEGAGGGVGRTRERLQFANKEKQWSPWWLRKRSLNWGVSAKGDFCGDSGEYNSSEEEDE